MNKSKQAGFTLIELIIVIVILGILAVTASPKFIDIQGDAKASTLQGVAGSLKGAANIVYSKALIAGEAGTANQALTGVTNVTVDFGYPEALETTIRAVLDLNSTEWEVGVTTGTDTLRIYPVGAYDGDAAAQDSVIGGDDEECYVQYVLDDSAASEPVITVSTSEC